MNTFVYILTDCNRTCLHVGLSSDLNKAINSAKCLSGFFLSGCSKVSRLVYQESLPSEEMALRRFQELSGYTRMQKERLIRKYNPNWIDLSTGITNHRSIPSTITPLRAELYTSYQPGAKLSPNVPKRTSVR
jgi:Predicted endonuclease containing a URI domain